MFLKSRMKGALAGRMFDFRLDPLTFKEFLLFTGKGPLEPPDVHARELLRLFRRYIETQGFPEMAGVEDRNIIEKYIKESIVEKVLFRDIPTLFGVRDVDGLSALLNILMHEPGQMIELADVAGQLNLSRQSVSSYLRYLEDSFLVRRLYNYSRNRRKVERKLKKYYPTVLSPEHVFRDDVNARSRVFESVLVNRLGAEFFWRDPFKNEVDMVLGDEEPLPVEVKHGKVGTGGVLKFMDRFGVKNGLVLTWDKEDELETPNGCRILVTPAYKYLLE
jgi:predicted AAA+ superfamily ATPase